MSYLYHTLLISYTIRSDWWERGGGHWKVVVYRLVYCFLIVSAVVGRNQEGREGIEILLGSRSAFPG